ncbi:MAG: hypothetical protein MR945_09265 [Agathobacter sp.]|nr:hypothetical protein [Agathobacter sp.]
MTLDEAEKIKNVVENKKYIEQLVEAVSKTLVEAFENLKIEDVNMFKLGYNKAIDDFKKEIKDAIDIGLEKVSPLSDVGSNLCTFYAIVDEIAEQLKGGDGE